VSQYRPLDLKMEIKEFHNYATRAKLNSLISHTVQYTVLSYAPSNHAV
jgi:hypothetical protein